MKQYKISEFLRKQSDRLVDVNGDDAETGSYRLMESEKDRVSRFQKQGFVIATIWQEGDGETEETVTFEFENSREHPFVTGYFILTSDEYKGMRTRKEILETRKDSQDAIDEYAELGYNGEEGEAHIYEGWVEALDYVLGKAPVPEFPVEDDGRETPRSFMKTHPELDRVFNMVADAILYSNYPRNLNGTFSQFELLDPEYQLDTDNRETEDAYQLNIKFGQQDDTASTTHQCCAVITHAEAQKWLKGKQDTYPKFVVE